MIYKKQLIGCLQFASVLALIAGVGCLALALLLCTPLTSSIGLTLHSKEVAFVAFGGCVMVVPALLILAACWLEKHRQLPQLFGVEEKLHVTRRGAYLIIFTVLLFVPIASSAFRAIVTKSSPSFEENVAMIAWGLFALAFSYPPAYLIWWYWSPELPEQEETTCKQPESVQPSSRSRIHPTMRG